MLSIIIKFDWLIYQVAKILANPDMLEQLIVTTPGLSADPVAMSEYPAVLIKVCFLLWN